LEEIYQLLYHNYVEDSDGCFRFNYSKKFLQWALLHPGFKKELFFGIRDKDNQIIAFISGIVLMVKLDQKAV
jgi:glycylpeptide N-tetradecanoyltransferase